MLERLFNVIAENSALSILYYIIAIALAGCFLHWMIKPSSKLDLPTFDVTQDVVATLERAHKQVNHACLDECL